MPKATQVQPQLLPEADARLVICRDDLRELGLQFGRTKLTEMVNENQFPKPIKIAGRNFWKRADVVAWIENQFAESTA